MAFGSLCAGIGGFDLGLERAGMVCAWQVERNPFRRAVLASHWPAVERFEDVRQVGTWNLRPVDLVCGGFPCQPHSLAGKLRGADDERNLWPEFARIAGELRPRWCLFENVPGIRRTILDEVLADLEGLGYAVGAVVLPACAVDAPHVRERVFVVAHSAVRRADEPGPAPGACGSRGSLGAASGAVADALRERLEASADVDAASLLARGCRWAPEPAVGRVVDGFPGRVAGIKALGDAVVPQLVEWLGVRVQLADGGG